MAKILVHVTCGPEQPTRAALAFFVARAALDEGHTATLFLAGDAVQLMRNAVLDGLTGVGTGSLREHYERLAAGGVKFYLSGGSSKTRGLTEADLAGKAFEFGTPNLLVRLALEHDRVLSYCDRCFWREANNFSHAVFAVASRLREAYKRRPHPSQVPWLQRLAKKIRRPSAKVWPRMSTSTKTVDWT